MHRKHIGQPAISVPSSAVNNWRILLEQGFATDIPLLMAVSTYRLVRIH